MKQRPGVKDNASNNTNRAEEIRQRRSQRSQQRISSVSSHINSPVKSRPVTVRGNTFGTPVHRQAGTRTPRRQFYLTMDQAAGTELRLPAIRLVNPGWRLLSGLLLILAAVGAFSMWGSPFFQVQTVEVKGLQRVSSDEINARLKLENYSIIEINPVEIKQRLVEQYDDLINVRVSVEIPNIVTVSAEERQPTLAFQIGDQTKWVDADGYLFTANGDGGTLLTVITEGDLPLVPLETSDDQKAGQDAASEEASAKSQPAAAQTGPRQVDPLLLTAVQGLSQVLPPETQLIYSARDGMGWTDQNGWRIYIGRDLANFEEKYIMYQGIANNLSNQGLSPSMVSVEHLNAPYYRLEQ